MGKRFRYLHLVKKHFIRKLTTLETVPAKPIIQLERIPFHAATSITDDEAEQARSRYQLQYEGRGPSVDHAWDYLLKGWSYLNLYQWIPRAQCFQIQGSTFLSPRKKRRQLGDETTESTGTPAKEVIARGKFEVTAVPMYAN